MKDEWRAYESVETILGSISKNLLDLCHSRAKKWRICVF